MFSECSLLSFLNHFCLGQLAIEKAIMNMPLEFRGNDPVCICRFLRITSFSYMLQTLRRHAESVVETLMDNPNGLESECHVSSCVSCKSNPL